MAELKVKYPPGPDSSGKLLHFYCNPEHEGCGAEESAYCDFNVDNDKHSAVCPSCGKRMLVDWDRFNVTIGAGKKGYHSTKVGRRRKRDMIRRNEKLGQTQWDNVDHGYDLKDIREGRRKFKNATPGGPLDLNSKFHKRTR